MRLSRLSRRRLSFAADKLHAVLLGFYAEMRARIQQHWEASERGDIDR